MTGTRRPVAILLALTLAVGAAPAWSAQLYRYENDEGVIVLSSTLPPRFATRGYTVIDERGRVLRVVPRQLTAQEVEAREVQRRAEEAERQASLERRRQDEELMRLYSSPEDVERAMERQIDTIQGAIDTVRANIQRLRTQKRNLESRAAERERAGESIPGSLIDGIRELDGQIADRQREIANREAEIEAVREDYAEDRARVRYLLGLDEEEPNGESAG
jgi:flagellar export protein FliJ